MDSLVELLSNQEKTLETIQNIATYIIYLYPGIISICLMDFFEARSTKETTSFVVKIFAVSYIYNLIIERKLNYINDTVCYNISLIIMALVVPLLVYKIKYSRVVSWICSFLGIRTCITGIPFELIKNSEEDYTCVKIFLKDSQDIYVGYMEHYEYEKEMEHFIILTGYKKYSLTKKGKEKIVIDNRANALDEKIYIRCDEIKYMEKISQERAKDIYSENI